MANAPLHLFGILAVRHGALRPDQLQLLLQAQVEDPHTPLGELARRRGFLTARQVRRLLEIQRSGPIDPDLTTFGSLLLQNNLATLDDIGLALRSQRSSKRDPSPIGEILVGLGALEVQEQNAILVAQQRLRAVEPASELDYETRLLPALVGPTPPSPEPQGWLIQETGDDLGSLFPLAHRSEIGRLTTHDVPVPDMAASRDHAVIEYSPAERRHVISDLDSRNGTFLNGAQVIRPHPLNPGDRIQIGSTIFRYVAGGGIGGGHNTIVGRLGSDAARAALGVASKAFPTLKGAASAVGETARRILHPRRSRLEVAIERRDSLLDRLGLAAFDANPRSTPSQEVEKAKKKLEDVRRAGEPTVIRWAERRLGDAIRHLGRLIVERGPAPQGEMPVIVEIRELDAEILNSEPAPTEPAPAE
jgi:hypothetical protein